jgi:hypothetical protein
MGGDDRWEGKSRDVTPRKGRAERIGSVPTRSQSLRLGFSIPTISEANNNDRWRSTCFTPLGLGRNRSKKAKLAPFSPEM